MYASRRPFALLSFVALLLSACGASDNPVDGATSAPSLASLQPANAAIGVDPGAPVVLRFNHAMMTGMEMLVVLHEESVTGAVVAAVATWSEGRTVLTLNPQVPLKRATRHVVHLSPSLQDTAGRMINMSPATMMGGQTVSGSMMGGGSMMNGQWGPGMMGAGWQASNGTFGVMFTFTTS
ncbi:MAG: Ig-like domain-containing protein [Gemmatimonadaceae bacterium]|jgi:hypothetical protein